MVGASTGLFPFLVGLFQEGLGRVENGKEVCLGSKTGKRFGSGRKREGGLTRVENRKEVWVGSKTGVRFRSRRNLGRVENKREVWVGLKTGGRLYCCTYAPSL